MTKYDGIEIPDNMLESISGGVIDDASRNQIKELVTLFKESGETVDSILDGLSSLETESEWDEVKSFIIEVYPNV